MNSFASEPRILGSAQFSQLCILTHVKEHVCVCVYVRLVLILYPWSQLTQNPYHTCRHTKKNSIEWSMTWQWQMFHWFAHLSRCCILDSDTIVTRVVILMVYSSKRKKKVPYFSNVEFSGLFLLRWIWAGCLYAVASKTFSKYIKCDCVSILLRFPLKSLFIKIHGNKQSLLFSLIMKQIHTSFFSWQNSGATHIHS